MFYRVLFNDSLTVDSKLGILFKDKLSLRIQKFIILITIDNSWELHGERVD